MSQCVKFVDRRALIIYQDDYSLTKLVHSEFGNLPATNQDKQLATQIAHGFGIADQAITYMNSMHVREMNDRINVMKNEFKALGMKGKRSFLFVYVAGHGVAD